MSDEQWHALKGLKGNADKSRVIAIMREWQGSAADKWTWYLQWAYLNGASREDSDLRALTGRDSL